MTGYETPVSYSTFAMLLLYFVPRDSLPNPLHGNLILDAKVIDFLPADTHYQQLSAMIHPDRGITFAKYQPLADASWELWKQTLLDPKTKDAPVPPNPYVDPASSAKYVAKGDVYERLSTIFYDYLTIWCFVNEKLSPAKLSPAGLRKSLASTVESRKKLVNSSLDDRETGMKDLEHGIEEIIAQGKLFSSTLPKKRRKAGPQDAADEVAESIEEDEIDDEDEIEEEDNMTAEVRKGKKRAWSEGVIDPALLTIPTGRHGSPCPRAYDLFMHVSPVLSGIW
jgi:hypothetical protein